MPKVLTQDQIQFYDQNGFLFPVNCFSKSEAATLSSRVASMEAQIGHELQARFRIKAHLPFPWLCDVIRHAPLLDAVEDVIGPNILCWGASFFSKQAHDPRYISWHNDTYFYAFDPPETLSAWVSFNDATLKSGCVQYIPGSHRGPPPEHEFKPHPDNLAPDGRTVIGVDESLAVPAILDAGQVVFHHESVIHGSGPNNASHPRVGFVIHYIAPHVRETRYEGATAMLCRGVDTHGYWKPDPEPRFDLDPDCIALMEETRALFLSSQRKKVAALQEATIDPR
ncbi:MAG: phytanoyl-CoA dioxygenase family protein [Beijerinckiaceae bacterium]